MIKLAKSVMIGSVVLFAQVTQAEEIDILVLVEPSVIQSMGKEPFSQMLESQIAYSNKEFKDFNVQYNVSAVVDWNDSVGEAVTLGDSYYKAGGHIFYSLGVSKEKYDADFGNDPWLKGKYSPEINALVNKYHADKVMLFVHTQTDNVIGRAFDNIGLIVHAQSMMTAHSTVAHELGHTFGLGHPSNDVCANSNYLMCQGKSNGSEFAVEEASRITGVLNRDPAYLLDYYNQDFWAGAYSQPMEMLATAKVSVIDNPVPNTLNKTEAVVELLDSQGAPYVFDKDVSVELFTKGVSATAGTHYDTDVYQRVTFAAGETVKRIDLPVTHDSKDVSLIVGVRYGENTADSNQETVVIKAKSSSGGGDTGNGGDSGESGGGGSLGIWGIILLPLAFLRRKF
ncbi:SVAGG family GlyGly-CTERM protein [Shewanella sp. M16]|uniref:SVAGG family GlyGly-CTERM protein n=1 Tax=Shewanella sp. M16 TaxID=2830837 RepID=UPI001BB00F6E|nr:SVAGG family GlyGly-CTERM protein [Shewanella sp. M16]MBS0044630.1 SVAGG family GlyGly-CTERM protein [Shewanella sp. M16]